MQTSIRKPQVAYIGLSLELYLGTAGKSLNTWRNAFDSWSAVLAQLADVKCRKLCFTDAEISEIGSEIKQYQLDAVVISAVSYTPSMLVVPLLKSLDIPVIIWNTQDAAVIKDDYAPIDLTDNHTVQGIQDITNVLFRSGIKYSIVSGHWRDGETLCRLAGELAVARAVQEAKNIRVLSLGGFFAGMGDFEFDPEAMKNLWGPQFIEISKEIFLDEVKNISADDVECQRQKDMLFFDIHPSLAAETHRDAIRRKLAIANLLKKHRGNAFTMNFTNLLSPDFGQLPFYAINTLMAEGIGYAGEGDILRAAFMRQLFELSGNANFSEIYTVDFKRDLFFMSHMQECNIAVARKDRKIILKQMPFWVPGMPDYPGMFFTAEPGEYTLACITPDTAGKFRMMAFSGAVDDLPVLETYDRAYWLFHPRKKVTELLDNYSLAGGAHHLSAVSGNLVAQLQLLAEKLNFDFVDLDR